MFKLQRCVKQPTLSDIYTDTYCINIHSLTLLYIVTGVPVPPPHHLEVPGLNIIYLYM